MTDEPIVGSARPAADRAPHPSRRTLLRGAAFAGVGLPILAACGSGGGSSNGATSAPVTPGAVLTTTADVPEGGGVILDKDGLVVTQPQAGTFKGFSNICTHQGCPVDNVSDGTINCTCHGSQFSIADGSVVSGPAPEPLPAKNVTVKGKDITLA
jgi:nitrite reductase/ring-hydroxylating ferredoxin subunit